MTAASSPLNASRTNPIRHYLHLWLPRLAVDRVRREQPDLPRDRPLVLVAKTRNAMRVVAVDAAAQDAGLVPGSTLRAAQSQVPHVLTAPFDPAADNRLLQRLVTLCRRFTPSLAEIAADEIVLDITGVAPFGDEAKLRVGIEALFAGQHVTVRTGLAGTPGLARALARYGDDRGAASGHAEAALAALPVEALLLPDGDTAALRGLGFRLVAEVMARPRAVLAEVVEDRLGIRLDELIGQRPCPLTLKLEPVRLFAEQALANGMCGTGAVLHVVARLAKQIESQLDRHRLGGRIFRLTLFDLRGQPYRVEVGGRQPVVGAAAITTLFARRLEASGHGADEEELFDRVHLEATLAEPVQARTPDLLDYDAGEARFESFLQSIDARGCEAVEVIRADTRTALPEREAAFAPYGTGTIGDGPAAPPPAWGDAILRPLRLFDPPQPIEVLAGVPDDPPAIIVWRRINRRITKAEGPERIAAEWGRETPASRTRDYYRVEDAEGRRYWVFRDGLFSEAAAPSWYLHGLFA